MKLRIVFLVILFCMLCGNGLLCAQTYPTTPPLQEYGTPLPGPNANAPPPITPSEWILYRRPDCCGPVGGHGPIHTELYARSGISFPFGGGVYGRSLGPGWVAQGGARVLFFNQPMSHAWFLDVSVSNVYNRERIHNTTVPMSFVVPGGVGQPPRRINFGQGGVPPVTLRSLNRTFFNFGGGKMWYLNDPNDPTSWHWRLGFDVGGRYGSGRARFVEVRKTSHPLYGTYAAIQGDVEIPCGRCNFIGGLRTEWDYTWTSILQSNNANFQEINLLFHFGVRY